MLPACTTFNTKSLLMRQAIFIATAHELVVELDANIVLYRILGDHGKFIGKHGKFEHVRCGEKTRGEYVVLKRGDKTTSYVNVNGELSAGKFLKVRNLSISPLI